jgi:hypothetical protein
MILAQENNCSSFVLRSNSRSANLPSHRYLFVWIYFKKLTRYHLSTNYETTKPQNYPTTAFVWHVFKKSAQIARRARWLPATTLAPHCRRSWCSFQGVRCTLALAGSARGAGVAHSSDTNRWSHRQPLDHPSRRIIVCNFFFKIEANHSYSIPKSSIRHIYTKFHYSRLFSRSGKASVQARVANPAGTGYSNL